jgi:hypothetical protein
MEEKRNKHIIRGCTMSDNVNEDVEVWVELPLDNEQSSSKGLLANKLALDTSKKKGLELNNKQKTVFRRGFCSKEAFLAAELMKKAAGETDDCHGG